MERLHIYKQLNVIYPEKDIFYRLGGNTHLTKITDCARLHISSAGRKAYSLCRPQGRWKLKAVKYVGENGVFFSDDMFLCGSRFAAMAENASYIWFAAATVGEKVITERDLQQNVSDSVIYDAVAGEVADSTMDMVQKLATAELARSGMVLDKSRYSPGYGDMPLEEQKAMFSILDMNDMNLKLTESCFIVPEKSVTAVAAVMMSNRKIDEL